MGKRSGWLATSVASGIASSARPPSDRSNHFRLSPRVGDVVALPCRHRKDELGLDADACQELPVLGRDLVERVLRVVDQVHLVDDDDDLANADQAQQIAVAARLFLHAFGGVDEDERGVGARRAGHHVLDELLVAGRVDDDVFALRGAKPDLRGVDRDVLVALGLQARPSGWRTRTARRAAARWPPAARTCRRAASRCRRTGGR